MMTHFFNAEGPALIEFLLQESTVKADQYADTITQWQKKLKK